MRDVRHCRIPNCTGLSDSRSVAVCREHLRPHVEEMEARRQANPFAPPRPGEATRKKFNNTRWFWFQGCWRPE